MKQHTFSTGAIVIGGLALFVAGGALGLVGAGYSEAAQRGPSVGVERPSDVSLDLFWEVWTDLEGEYVYEDVASDETLVYGAIKGVVESLDDQFTVFMDPDETERFQADLNQELIGIGAQLSEEDQLVKVVAPLKGSPAEAAGVKSGDIIYKIDGELATDLNMYEAVEKIRGEEGTQVTLTMLREGTPEPLDITITRAVIELDSVTTEVIDDDIFYISLNQFSDNTAAEFLAASREVLLSDAKGVILDLRYNGGGYLNTAVDILNEFLPAGELAVEIVGRDPEFNEDLYTNGRNRLGDYPVVVLVNQGSASAAEIVAGALQDYGVGYVIGTQTFGKGSVQRIINYPDDSSLRITVAAWHTPNGTDINKAGITPNEVIEISAEDVTAEIDPQRQRAIEYLRERI